MTRAVAGGWGKGRGVGAGLALDERCLQGQTGGGHTVVLGEDQGLSAVLAVHFYVTVASDVESVQDVRSVVAVDPVEVEEEGLQLGTDDCTAVLVPAEGGATIS